MRFFGFLVSLLILSVLATHSVYAQDPIPEVPAPIQNLIAEGAQIRFLGKDHGVDAWLTVKNGQEQYFYVLPGGEAFLMGVMFDKSGKLVTVSQVRRLREGGDPMLDTLAASSAENLGTQQSNTYDFKTPSEQMFSDVSASNWVALGQRNAPIAYAFVDPQCGHCHAFVNDIRDEITNGKIQLRIIPVGFFGAESQAQSAFLIAAPNPQERWFKHMDGDKEALPAKTELNNQGVQRNMAIMQSWKFDATPMVIYRDKAGKVKLVRGRPKDADAIIADLGQNG